MDPKAVDASLFNLEKFFFVLEVHYDVSSGAIRAYDFNLDDLDFRL